MRRLVLVIEYDGTRYHGFQLQPNARTIQGEVESALGKLTGERIRIGGASRTDAGVHALGQVITFVTDSRFSSAIWVRALNHYLPVDIVVRSTREVNADFDARRCAISRKYRYNVLNRPVRSPLKHGFVYLVRQPLDVEAMNRASQVLVGEHDFIPFVSLVDGRGRSTVRFVYEVGVRKESDFVVFDVVGNSFLPRQLRNAVGGLIKVGLGKLKVDDFCEQAGSKVPGIVKPMVPACGLCLMKVNYPVSWGPIGEE